MNNLESATQSSSSYAKRPTINLMLPVKDAEEQKLSEFLATPQALSVENLIQAVDLLEKSMERSKNLLILNQFVRIMTPQMEELKQYEPLIQLYLYTSEYYPLFQGDQLNLERVWILSRALKLSEKYHFEKLTLQIKQMLDDCEQRIVFHPYIIQGIVKTNPDEIEVEKAVKANVTQLHSKVAIYLENAEKWALGGKLEVTRELYDALPQIVFNAMKNVPVENRDFQLYKIYEIIGQKKKSLPNDIKKNYQWQFFREEFLDIKNSCKNCKDFSLRKRLLLKRIFEYCHTSLGHAAPCAFEVLELGSLTREEAIEVSDLDCAFIIADPAQRYTFITEFLPRYIPLVRFYLGCLDDLWIINSLNSTFPIQRVACDIDEGDIESILGNNACIFHLREKTLPKDACPLVHAPRDLANLVHNFEKMDEDKQLTLLAFIFSLIFSKSLYKSSSETLYDNYRDLLIYENKQKMSAICTHFFKFHLKDLKNRFIPTEKNIFSNNGWTRNLKKSLIHPLTLFSFDLALYWGYLELFTFHSISTAFEKEKRLPDFYLSALNKAWDVLHQMRWVKQKEWKSIPDAGSPNEMILESVNQSGYEPLQRMQIPKITPAECQKIDHIHKTVLVLAESSLIFLAASQHHLHAFNPLLVHCQLHFAKAFSTMSSRVKAIETIVGERAKIKMGNIFDEYIPLPEEVKNWLISDFRKRVTEDEKLGWFLHFLKLEILFYWIDPKDLEKLENLLHLIPAKDGWKLAQDIELFLFYRDAQELFSEHCDDPVEVKFSMLDLADPFNGKRQTYFIKKLYRQQFLNDQAQFLVSNDPRSLHSVPSIKVNNRESFWIKACPENASLEYLAWQIAWRTGSGGITPSLTATMTAMERKMTIIFSRHAEGISWADIPQKCIDLISPASFTQSLIRILATSPEDDRPEDYLLKPVENEFVLQRIDNERLFCEPVDVGVFFDEINLKSVLLFHDLMKKPLDKPALELFLMVDPHEMIKSLLISLERLQVLFGELFSKEDVLAHFKPQKIVESWKIKNTEICLLTVFITQKWMIKLLRNVQTLHFCCNNAPTTGMELLKIMHPKLFNLIQKGWSVQLAGQLHSSLERLDSLKLFFQDGNKYRKSATNPVQVICQSQGIKKLTQSQLLDSFQKKSNSPTQAIAEVELIKKESIKETVDQLNDSNPAFVKAFSKQLGLHQNHILDVAQTEKILSSKQMKLVLQALLKSKDLQGFREIRLSNFPELNNSLFLELLANCTLLENLYLRNCNNISERNLAYIPHLCKSIKRLYLIDLDILFLESTSMTYLRFEKSPLGEKHWTLHFPHLHHLSLKECKKITQLTIYAPHLQSLEIVNCPLLAYVHIFSNQINGFLIWSQLYDNSNFRVYIDNEPLPHCHIKRKKLTDLEEVLVGVAEKLDDAKFVDKYTGYIQSQFSPLFKQVYSYGSIENELKKLFQELHVQEEMRKMQTKAEIDKLAQELEKNNYFEEKREKLTIELREKLELEEQKRRKYELDIMAFLNEVRTTHILKILIILFTNQLRKEKKKVEEAERIKDEEVMNKRIKHEMFLRLNKKGP